MAPPSGHYIRMFCSVPFPHANQMSRRVFETGVQYLSRGARDDCSAQIHDVPLPGQAWNGTECRAVPGFQNSRQGETIPDAFPLRLIDNLGGGIFEQREAVRFPRIVWIVVIQSETVDNVPQPVLFAQKAPNIALVSSDVLTSVQQK